MNQNDGFHELIVTERFRAVVEMMLGDRSHLDIPDADVFPLVMRVIFFGRSHAQVATDRIPAEVVLARHREWAACGAMSSFLITDYPELFMGTSGVDDLDES